MFVGDCYALDVIRDGLHHPTAKFNHRMDT